MNPRPGAVTVQVIGVLATISAVLPAFVTGAVGVQLRDDIGIGETAFGLAIAFFFASATLFSAVMGHFTERLGPVRALRIGVSLAGAVALAIVFFADDFAVLALLLAVGGVANAINQPAANLLLANQLPSGRLGFAVGVKQSGMPAATLIGGLTVPTLATTVSWQAAYLPAAGLAAVTLAMLAPVAHEPSTLDLDQRSISRERGELDTPTPVLLRLATGMIFGAAAAAGLASFLVSSAEEAGVSAGVAGLTLSLGSACGIAVRLLIGHDADRRPARDLPIVAALLTAGAGAFGLLAVHDPLVTVLATPLAFGAGWAWPGRFNLAVMRANPAAPARATGLTQTGTYLGALIGPIGFGLVVEASGYTTAWLLVSASALVAATVFITTDHRLRRIDRGWVVGP